MSLLSHSVFIALVWILCWTWTVRHAKGCGDQQTAMNGHCCDKCSPGTHLDEFCSNEHQTICKPCKAGHYSDAYHSYDQCVECQSCQQKYVQNCTPTTNAVCDCYPGFLCSNKRCTKCVKNKCTAGENMIQMVVSSDSELEEYSYSCVDLCPEDEYFDVKTNLCKPRKKCDVQGLNEQLPRNKAEDSVCFPSEAERPNQDSIHVPMVWGFILLSVTLLVLLSYQLLKKLKKHRQENNPIMAVTVDTDTFNLSKEESGLQFIIHDGSKSSSSCSGSSKLSTA